MANFTITISNSLNTFGPAPSDKWNSYNWNAFKWGEGTVPFESVVNHFITTNFGGAIFSSSMSLVWDFKKTIDNSISPDADMYSEHLSDGSGYNYVFASNVTDAESRTIPSYNSAAAATTTWSSAAAAATTWS